MIVQRWALLLAAAASLAAVGATEASAAPSTQIIEGRVIRLESVQDAEAMRAMEPGEPVAWDVGVSATEPEGTIDVALAVGSTPDAYRATVTACASAWRGGDCAEGATPLFDGVLVDGVEAIATQPAAATVWYRVEVELLAPIGGATAELVLSATGAGETVASGGDVTLPQTGRSVLSAIGPAIAAVGLGIVIAALTRRRARDEAAP